MKMNHARGLLPALAILALATPAMAQDATGFELEEIVVTARKRVERLQDVPDSITALSATALEERGVEGIGDVLDFVPGLSMAQGQNPGTVTISARGISQVRNGEAPVAIVIDGVQLASPNQITQELYDLERVEVLKGPQGALYGRNAIAGAINIVTREPGNDPEFSARAELANGGDRKLRLAGSGALVEDKVLVRASLGWRDFDGLIRNQTLDRKADFQEEWTGRARIILKPADDLSIDLRGSFSNLEAGAAYYVALPDGQPNNTSIPVLADVLGDGFRRLRDVSAKLDYDVGGGTITAVTAYSSTHEFFHEDLDWLPQSILEASQDLRVEAISQELRYTSDATGPLRYVVGAYWLDTDRDVRTEVFANAGGSMLKVADTPEANRNRALAGFGQLNYDVAEGTELTLAMRYDTDRRRQTDPRTGVTRQKSFDAWQPKASLSYRLDADTMAYATWAKGFRSGGFNAPSGVFAPVFRAEDASSYELGMKSEMLNRRVVLNLAAYSTKYDNQQTFLLDATTGAQGIVNIAGATARGVEAELTARIAPGLEANASASLIDSEIDNFDGTGLYKGNQVPYVNGWSYALGLSHTTDLPGGSSLTSRVDYTANGDLAFHVDNADKRSPVHLVDLRLSWETGPVTLTGYVKNLFDERYSVEFFAREFIGTARDIRWPNEPRRMGVEAAWRF